MSSAFALTAAIGLAACSDSDDPATDTPDNDSSTPNSAEVIAARQHIFGEENVDPETGETPDDVVLFSWLTASSFAASVQGRVFMMDTFVTRMAAPTRFWSTFSKAIPVTGLSRSQSQQGPGIGTRSRCPALLRAGNRKRLSARNSLTQAIGMFYSTAVLFTGRHTNGPPDPA